MTKIDERLLRINSNPVILFGKLKMDENVSMLVKGNVIKIEDKTNDNGTVDRIFVIKGTIGEVVSKEKVISEEASNLELQSVSSLELD